MKLKIIILILLIVNSKFVLSQNLEVTYIQALENKKVTNSIKQQILKGITYKLFCNHKVSLFKIEDRLNDEVSRINGLYVAKAGGKSIYYRNFKTQEKYKTLRGIEENNVLVKINVDEYNIKITNESKKINNYKCYKAIYYKKSAYNNYTINIIAWFTPEIPFPFGPRGFDGLPGLILELNYKGNIFIAQKIKFLDYQKPIIKPKGNIYTFQEVKDLFRKKTSFDIDKHLLEKRDK